MTFKEVSNLLGPPLNDIRGRSGHSSTVLKRHLRKVQTLLVHVVKKIYVMQNVFFSTARCLCFCIGSFRHTEHRTKRLSVCRHRAQCRKTTVASGHSLQFSGVFFAMLEQKAHHYAEDNGAHDQSPHSQGDRALYELRHRFCVQGQ